MNLLRFLFILGIFIDLAPRLSVASELLILAPGADQLAYENLIRNQPSYLSPQQFWKARKEKLTELDVLSLSDEYFSNHLSVEAFLTKYREIKKTRFFSEASRMLMLELLQKIEKTYSVVQEICSLQLKTRFPKCSYSKINFIDQVQRYSDQIEIWIDGQKIQSVNEVYLPVDVPHQIVFLSNSAEAIELWTDTKHVEAKSPLALVAGSCDQFQITPREIGPISEKIFFSSDCVVPAFPPTLPTLKSESNVWLWAGLGIGAGLLVYSLKDKDLEISLPGFSF